MGVDALVIPGGGLTASGSLPEWVVPRFERALSLRQNEYVIPLSGGTTHRPLHVSAKGQPIYEAHVGALWLMERGVPESRILPESLSYDTIGNAVFTRLLHTDPRGLRRLHVISSVFHLPRCEAIFDWIFSLDDAGYSLSYESTPDLGIAPAALAARIEKEQAGVASIAPLRARLPTLAAVHEWLYTEHAAYRASRPGWGQVLDAKLLQSY